MTNQEVIEYLNITENDSNCDKCSYFDKCENDKCNDVRKHIIKALEENEKLKSELEHYKNLKKEGRLMELPCRVGDIVYSIDTFSISEWSVMSISITVFNRNIEVVRYGIGIYRTFDEFKEQFYTTREEAEKALVEMEGK